MYYEINVALNGKHYFATASRSLLSEHMALEALEDFKLRFKEEDGFTLTLTKHETIGTRIA